jgi:hypothetical protein
MSAGLYFVLKYVSLTCTHTPPCERLPFITTQFIWSVSWCNPVRPTYWIQETSEFDVKQARSELPWWKCEPKALFRWGCFWTAFFAYEHLAMFVCVCVCNVCMYVCLQYLIWRINLHYLGEILVAWNRTSVLLFISYSGMGRAGIRR